MSMLSEYILTEILVCLVIFLIIICIVLFKKYNNLKSKYYFCKKQYLCKANQMTMLEYHYRKFKEGRNAYTVLRDIGEIIYNYTEVDIDGE